MSRIAALAAERGVRPTIEARTGASMKVALPGRRSTVRDTSDGLELALPARRNIFALLFMTAWLCGWAFGEVAVSRQVVSGQEGGPALFLVAWLAMWTVGGGWAIYTWLWMASGKEIVILRSGSLLIRRETLGLGKTHEYELAHVKALRVSASSTDPMGWSRGSQFWGQGGGMVAFDYGAKTFRFAGAVDEAEAAQIVAELKARHPFAAA
jgi:hypothetical protein